MSKRMKFLLAFLGVLVYLETFLVISSPDVRWGANLVWKKLTGSIEWVGWPEVIATAVPHYVRPSFLPAVENPAEYLTTPVKVRAIERSDEACPVNFDTPLGDFWATEADAPLLAHLVNEQLEKRIYDQDGVQVEPGDIVIDGGAHLGTFTRFALQRGASKVVGFEPDPRNIACLKKTFQAEIAAGRLVLVEAALWNAPEELTFHVSHENSARSSIFRSEGDVVRVRAVTIDDVVAELGLRRLDFVKLDIEGAERHALEGSKHSLNEFRPRLAVCIYHLPDDPVEITRRVMHYQPLYQGTSNREVAYFY